MSQIKLMQQFLIHFNWDTSWGQSMVHRSIRIYLRANLADQRPVTK
jgi:hypothetical protein